MAECRRFTLHARDDERLRTKVRAAHTRSRRNYGSPRIHAELREDGERTSRKRVARLMREESLRGLQRRRFRRTTDSRHGLPVAPDRLARDFTASRPDSKWVGDITYVWTAEGWCYLAVLLDVFSRRVVGWALRDTLGRELALSALHKALLMRGVPSGQLVHHTDRGSQYASSEYRRRLAASGLLQSMSRPADCYDNAMAESFFATIKKECIHRTSFATRTEAYDAIADCIENFYNVERRHSAIGYVSPARFERDY
ncbi:MAG: IS3 family transposase, partial [Myxococcota bacterium]